MSSEESSPYTSRPISPLSTAITPPNIDTPQFETNQHYQFSLTPLSGGGPGSIAITPLPGSAIHSPQPSTMPFHLPRGFGGAHPPAPSHLKTSQSAADILPTPELALEANTMSEVRESIDKLDREIVTLLGTRLRFIEAAARIKEDRAKVRDEWRKKDVIEKAVKRGGEVGMDENILRGLYEVLVEGCIAYEGARWEEIRRKPYQEAPELVEDE